MKRIIKDVEFKHLSKAGKLALITTFKSFSDLIENRISYFNEIACKKLDQERPAIEEKLIVAYGECYEMLERLKADFLKEAERIEK